MFDEHVITCFIDDVVGLEERHHLNMDHITWECDYPHSDSTWPRSPEKLMESLGRLPDEEIVKITHRNAMEVFHYDPFAHIPHEQATVAGLRAQAPGWDVSVSPKAHLRPPGAAAPGSGTRLPSAAPAPASA